MSELDDIRAFVEVIEAGGFSRAADRLGLSKSIVSRRIGRLEAELGARLLSRTTRGIAPTEAGLEFKARGERLLSDLEEARDVVAQRGDEVVGTLRVSAPLSFGLRYVAPILAELAAAHPRLRLDVGYSDRNVDLIAERFDVAIRIGQLADSSLVARKIAPIRRLAAASPDYLDRRGRPETPADLARHECLVYSTATGREQWLFGTGKRQVAFRPQGRVQADNGDALVEAAVAGLGIFAGPTFLLAHGLESGALEVVLRDHPMPESGLYVVRPPGVHVPAKVRALTDLLAERFGGEPFWDACHRKCKEMAGY